MEIQCECGKFKAQLTGFPHNTPGRLVCYCDDCQTYLHHLNRADLLDNAGGTEIIPVYPAEFKILSGKENLKSTRLSPNGLTRWSTTCCNTPIANTRPKFPWVGLINRVYNIKDPRFLEKTLGSVRGRIYGKYAKGQVPKGTPAKMGLKDAWSVMPFLFKGMILGKSKSSPFFKDDGVTPIVSPEILSQEARNSLRKKLEF